MSEIKLFTAPLNIDFSEVSDLNEDDFYREFMSLVPNDEDPLGAWLKRAKSRGDTKQSDQVLLTLLIELHRKFDELKEELGNSKKSRINLDFRAEISSIGFEHIKLKKDKFIENKKYYARVLMPIFPKRELGFFLLAIDSNLAKILNIHQEDLNDWSSYVTARERIMIRELKGKN